MTTAHRRVDLSASFEQLESRTLFAAGALDTSYSSDGRAAIAGDPDVVFTAQAVAVQADGKTVIAGSNRSKVTGQISFAVARMNLDGTPDLSFGSDGTGVFTKQIGKTRDNVAEAVAIQPDGKIVIAGSAFVKRSFANNQNEMAVLRLTTNGQLDASFDGDGFTTVRRGDASSANDVVLQRDGKIVIAGVVTSGLASDEDVIVARLNTDGSLDKNFCRVQQTTGVSFGVATFGLGELDEARAVTIDYSGTANTNPRFGGIVVAGTKTVGALEPDPDRFMLARLTPSGFLDKTFKGKGSFSGTFPGHNAGEAFDLVVQPSGKIVIAGSPDNLGHGIPGVPMILERFNGDGSTDSSFGTGGTGAVETSFGGTDLARGLIQSADEGLIVAGSSNGKLAMAHYSADGVLDTSFGTAGKVVNTSFAVNTFHMGIAQGPGRRFTVASGTDLKSARFLESGANVVQIFAAVTQAREGTSEQASFFVRRTEKLPFATRVFINIGGWARRPSIIGSRPRDYNLSGMSLGDDFFTPPSVTIPANAQSQFVFLTPTNDSTVEGTESATFSIIPDASYEIGKSSPVKLTIVDDDGVSITPTSDAFVKDGVNQDLNFGASTSLQVKDGRVDLNRVSYLRFDLTATAVAGITNPSSVKLRLFGRLNKPETGGIATSVFSVTDNNWVENSITFRNRPPTTGNALATTTIVDDVDRFYDWDITALVRAALQADQQFLNIALVNLNPSNEFVTFSSREGGTPPQLLVAR